ncbi:MAG: hypothetical protein EA356_14940 [Geminicoccaceae bacterium]|nr:MAG: hypothetical protein EA356_14940 [Geminicoccaceae bacterium]
MAATLADLAGEFPDLLDTAEAVARLAASSSEEAGGLYGTGAVALIARGLKADLDTLANELDELRSRIEPAGGRGEVAR